MQIRHVRVGIAIGIVSYFGACAPVTFDAAPQSKGGNVVTRCEGSACYYDVTEEKTVGQGMVDILIVNDNSGSMSYEQAKMAGAFSGFLTSLDGLDYRIAMTTTDIASASGTRPDSLYYNPPSAYNGNGALQDGRLVEFSPGQKYLEKSTYNKETLFNNTIKRPETLQCEQSGYTQCPSGDERGIYAANLSLKNYSSQFMRMGAHLAVIVLADEDERGVSKYNPASDSNSQQIKSLYPLEALDEPQSFIDSFRSLFPSKTMSWHSIVIKNGDSGCLSAQSGQGGNAWVRGAYGSAYQKLSEMTSGLVGNICASNYTSQLQDIGYTIKDQVTSLPFRCRPIDDQFEVQFGGVVTTSGFAADFNAMTLNISAALAPSTKVTLKYTCSK